jgi:hypothetical protein
LDHVRRNHADHDRRLPRHRGLSGIIENEFYSVVPAAGTEATGDVYFLHFDATTWGWIHLVGGLIVLFAGFAQSSVGRSTHVPLGLLVDDGIRKRRTPKRSQAD